MPKQLKRFSVVVVNGQAFEVERPYGARLLRVVADVDGAGTLTGVRLLPEPGPADPCAGLSLEDFGETLDEDGDE